MTFFFLFGYIGRRLDEKAKVNFKDYDVINCDTNSYYTHIAQYRQK